MQGKSLHVSDPQAAGRGRQKAASVAALERISQSF